MDPIVVLQTWLKYGLLDLKLAEKMWDSDDGDYKYGVFFYITAVEKHLKAILLYESAREYSDLECDKALEKIDKVSRDYSHHFEKMISEVNDYLHRSGKRVIDASQFKYSLSQYVQAMKKGYMEIRYPTIEPVARNFPLGNGVYFSPLRSSEFIYFLSHICQVCKDYIVEQYNLDEEFFELHKA